jgi:hypothetical protein
VSGISLILSQLLARTTCDRCGGPLEGPEGPGRVRSLIVGDQHVLCGFCDNDDTEQMAAELDAEYWDQRKALEECADR